MARITLETLTVNKKLPPFMDDYFLKQTALRSRVLIIEGISGSGKDTLQAYLKGKLKGRDVYDYSEGELLQSWNQHQIGGISKLRVKFMKLFARYVKDVVSQNENAVFLLNRFHLSTYTSTIIQQPKLEKEYDEIINVLRTLPVHVFILQLDENEIDKRTLHPERSGVWRKIQQQMITMDGFRNRLERYLWLQGLMLDTAKRQGIPYTVIKFPSAPEIAGGWVHVPEAQNIFSRGARMNAADTKISVRKWRVPQTVEEDN